MSFQKPPFMLATDWELVEQFVQAKRAEVRALVTVLEQMDATSQFGRLRWKLEALVKEAGYNEAQILKSKPDEAQLEKAHPPTKEASG